MKLFNFNESVPSLDLLTLTVPVGLVLVPQIAFFSPAS